MNEALQKIFRRLYLGIFYCLVFLVVLALFSKGFDYADKLIKTLDAGLFRDALGLVAGAIFMAVLIVTLVSLLELIPDDKNEKQLLRPVAKAAAHKVRPESQMVLEEKIRNLQSQMDTLKWVIGIAVTFTIAFVFRK